VNEGVLSGEKLDDEHDNGNHNEYVDEASSYLETKPKEPKNQQDPNDRPEHNFFSYTDFFASLFLLRLTSAST
jgi:hypothetical protein